MNPNITRIEFLDKKISSLLDTTLKSLQDDDLNGFYRIGAGIEQVRELKTLINELKTLREEEIKR